LIYNENKRYSKALEVLGQLEKDYSTASIIVDSYFLAGVILTEIGENKQALEAFNKAKENSKDGLFVNVCNGKIADNYFILHSKRNLKEDLQKAIDIYQMLANDNTNDFFLRTQSFYKLGRSKELMEDYQGALDAYNESIYIALSNLDNNNQAIPAIWVNKCGVNAIKLNLKKGGRNARQDASRILDKLKEINRQLPAELLDLETLIK
jgi:tetratricopeptide (TPR) repeat protein